MGHFASMFMLAASDPNQTIIGFGIGAFILAALWRLIIWVRDAPAKPDPWDAEVEQQLQNAPEACPHCSTPQPSNAWFCSHCGRAVGPYNNLMPYLQIFSEGEVLRNSAHVNTKKHPFIMVGYFLLGFAFIPFFLLPLYWFSLARRFWRSNQIQNADKS